MVDYCTKTHETSWSVVDAIIVFFPVFAAWLLVYIVVWTVRWIRRGFQPST
jgi:hypothetical protein